MPTPLFEPSTATSTGVEVAGSAAPVASIPRSSNYVSLSRSFLRSLMIMVLTDVTGGDSADLDDDKSLDKKETLISPGHDEPEVQSRKKESSEAKKLFDKLQAEAPSQIATLTGGAKTVSTRTWIWKRR